MPNSTPSTGDIFLECFQKPGLLADLDTLGPKADRETLKKILLKYSKQSPSVAVLDALFADLQNEGMRIWLHELRTWVIAHPAPSTESSPMMLAGNTSWQPG